MTLSLEQALRSQREELETRFGALPRAHLQLEADVRFFDDVARAQDRERMGEVILVLRRPDGQVLLHTKTFYPEGIYRLPSGGINGNEPVMDAAAREAAEETELVLRDAQPIGLITYDLYRAVEHVDFHSWLVLAGVVGAARAGDPHERIEGYRWTPLDRLPQVASTLRSVPPQWSGWGHFRALAHDLVPVWIGEIEHA
jgi:8-oxo-dGTP pyrophosphatase MutT (NUDIX family)